MSNTLDRVKSIVVEHMDINPEKVTETASFIDDLGADSLDLVELVMAFEVEFDIVVDDKLAEGCLIVSDAVKLIERGGRSL